MYKRLKMKMTELFNKKKRKKCFKNFKFETNQKWKNYLENDHC